MMCGSNDVSSLLPDKEWTNMRKGASPSDRIVAAVRASRQDVTSRDCVVLVQMREYNG